MSNPSKVIKKLKKPFLKMAAVGLVAFGVVATGGALAGALGGAGAAAGTAAAGGAVKAGIGAIASKGAGLIAGASPEAMMIGGQMLSGAMQPTEADMTRDRLKVVNNMTGGGIADYSGAGDAGGGIDGTGSIEQQPMIQGPQQAALQNGAGGTAGSTTAGYQSPYQAPPTANQGGIIARYDPQTGKFVA